MLILIGGEEQVKFWWAIRTSNGREFYVKGGFNFNVDGRRQAEDRLDPGEELTGWVRVGEVFEHR